MLFFKQKQKPEEFMPPPPPVELEDEMPSAESQFTEKPKFFDELVKPKKAETIPEEEEFDNLVNEEVSKPKKVLGKAKSAKRLSEAKSSEQKAKVVLNRKAQNNQEKSVKIKQKNLPQAKPQSKKIKQPEKALEPELKDTELDDIDFEMHDLDGNGDIGLPQELEDFDINEFGSELRQKTEKPREIAEAQEEIQSAIEKIKKVEKPSFFNKLFAKREKEKPSDAYPIRVQNGNGIPIIQSNIKRARDALAKFDLEKAKKSYIEIIKMYNNLNPQDKAKVYHEIDDLYSERKSAEELKV